jgi:hypothetical protein
MNATWYRIILSLAAGLVSVPVRGGEDPPPIERRQLTASQNNLKQIGLAFHNHNDTFNRLPGDIMDKDGKALLSWRVAILPFIEQENLYKQFKLDEPWDSDNNKKLVAQMPKLYARVRVKAKEGETFYQVFTGKNALFDGKAATIQGIPDGSSNTGMVFEAGEPVVWTKPGDMAFDEKKALPKLGGLFDGDFHVCLGDGSVVRVKKGADEKELKKLIMPADGLVVDISKLTK